MDEKRIVILQEELERLTVLCAIILITYNTVGASIAGVQTLKTTMKSHILAILQDSASRYYKLFVDTVSYCTGKKKLPIGGKDQCPIIMK